MDEAFAEEEEVDKSTVTENLENCQAAVTLLEECICAIECFEDFAKAKAIALLVERRNDGNGNVVEAIGDLSTRKWEIVETRLDEESGFEAGVVQNADKRAATGSVMRHDDITPSERTVGSNVEGLTSSSWYRDSNPETERDELLRFG